MTKAEADKILQQTIEYLTGVSSSSYSPFIQSIPSTLPGIGQTDPLTGEITAQKPITGAMSALLPMTIATADSSGNKRVEFTMLINPENMNHGKTNSSYLSYTRKGYVSQLWGPNQDMLTGTGKSAAFMVNGTGLTGFLRRRSFGFQNFMALLRAYRNNGYMLVDPMNIRETVTRVISLVSGIEISYDGQFFMGHFNNFTMDEVAESPFIFTYNFEFVCSTLSNEYSQVRGHFRPIPVSTGAASAPKPVLLSEIVQTATDKSFFGDVVDFLTKD